MTFSSHRIVLFLITRLLSTACTQAPQDPQPIEPCPPEVCGVNNARLADEHFGRLSLDGEPNDRLLSISDVLDIDGAPVLLDVDHGRFVAVDPATGEPARDRDLAGTTILVREATDRGPAEWMLRIDRVRELDFFSDEPGTVPAYDLSYAPAFAPDTARPLCADGTGVVLIAGGETYDPETLAILPREHGRWFTLACQDHVLGKAKRMSYDPERAPADSYYTTVAQRQATLRMLRADYCGTGQIFTRPGVSLYWQNRAEWMVHGAPPDPEAERVEAAWDEHGATCLNTPRLVDHYAREDIEAACGRLLPECSEDDLATSEWVTWLP